MRNETFYYKYHANINYHKGRGNFHLCTGNSIKCIIVQIHEQYRFKKFILATIKLFNSDVKPENNISQVFLWWKKKKKYVQQSSIRLSKRSVSCFKNKLARFWSICPIRFFGKGWIIYYHASKNTRNVYKHQSRVSKIYVYDLWICPTLGESNCWSNRG